MDAKKYLGIICITCLKNCIGYCMSIIILQYYVIIVTFYTQEVKI